jgi:hypothetical protein
MSRPLLLLSILLPLAICTPADAEVTANELLSRCELFDRTVITKPNGKLVIENRQAFYCFAFISGIQAISIVGSPETGHSITGALYLRTAPRLS